MKNRFRSLSSAKGWFSIYWSSTGPLGGGVDRLLQDVGSVPGCMLHAQSIEIPHTAWMLPEVEALSEATDARVPEGYFAPTLPIWTPTQPLYDYQAQGVDFVLEQHGGVLADEMGIGKTRQAIAAAECVRTLGLADRPVFIIAPLSVRGTWLNELKAMGAIADASQFCALETRDIKDESFQLSPTIRYYFVHFDIARAWWPKKLELDRVGRSPCFVIVDEAHLIRNSKTNRAKGALMIAGTAQRKLLLTGTPLDNSPSDLWFPLTLATGARTWGGPIDFRKRYAGATHNGFGYQDGESMTNVRELKARMAPFYLRRTAEQVGLQLPELTRSVQMCALGKYEREHSDVMSGAAIEQLVRAIATGSMSDQVLKQLTRLRQITSAAKLPATYEYVCNVLAQQENAVVFTWAVESAYKLYAALCGTSDVSAQEFGAITGETTQRERERLIDWFQTSTQPRVLVATLGALSVGVTLHASRIVVMHDLHWVLSDMLQGEKRIHRIGQRRGCQSVWMLAENSIDTLMEPILRRKAELMAQAGIESGSELMKDVSLYDLGGREAVEDQVDRALRVWGA